MLFCRYASITNNRQHRGDILILPCRSNMATPFFERYNSFYRCFLNDSMKSCNSLYLNFGKKKKRKEQKVQVINIEKRIYNESKVIEKSILDTSINDNGNILYINRLRKFLCVYVIFTDYEFYILLNLSLFDRLIEQSDRIFALRYYIYIYIYT